MLLTDRRRTLGMGDEEDTDRLQGSLFGPDAFAPARSAGPTPDPFAPVPPGRPPDALEAPLADAPEALAPGRPDDVVAPSAASPAATGFDELIAPPPEVDAERLIVPGVEAPGATPADDLDARVASELAAAADLAPDAEARALYADDLDTLPPLDYLDGLAPEVASPSEHGARTASPLSGPTLDDVMSRVWETMRAQVPAPCPVCHAEVEPSMGGRCGACGSALD